MFAELIALGALFWLGLIVSVIIVCAMVDTDSLWWPFTVVIIGGALFEFFHDASLLTTMKTWTPSGVVYTLAGYLLIGLIVFYSKWLLFMRERKEKYKEAKATFVANKGRIDTKEKKEKFVYELRSRDVLRTNEVNITPLASNYKRRIGAWIVWWPATLLNAIFRDLAKHLYYMVRRSVDQLSKKYFADTERDFQSLGK